jgi:hypothetical protein
VLASTDGAQLSQESPELAATEARELEARHDALASRSASRPGRAVAGMPAAHHRTRSAW